MIYDTEIWVRVSGKIWGLEIAYILIYPKRIDIPNMKAFV